MIFTRSQFFITLFSIIVLPIVAYKIIWLLRSSKAVGEMEFVGHGNYGSILGVSTYPVIIFTVGKDTFHFNGNLNIPLKRGQKVELRYLRHNPSNAKINTFLCIWGDTITYTLGPLLAFLGIFFAPDIVPRRSKLKVGIRPLVRILQ
jgi:hypothetical protein